MAITARTIGDLGQETVRLLEDKGEGRSKDRAIGQGVTLRELGDDWRH